MKKLASICKSIVDGLEAIADHDPQEAEEIVRTYKASSEVAAATVMGYVTPNESFRSRLEALASVITAAVIRINPHSIEAQKRRDADKEYSKLFIGSVILAGRAKNGKSIWRD